MLCEKVTCKQQATRHTYMYNKKGKRIVNHLWVLKAESAQGQKSSELNINK